MQPYQQRVIEEKAQLDERLLKLQSFIMDGGMYWRLPEDEQKRLSLQAKHMSAYSEVLGERIAAFGE